ncbi:MAG: ABC transporter ATP-binding protein [Clostridiales bacterium]|nr:ABC transporter ATP-binding protein [Clostridiales bacterium]
MIEFRNVTYLYKNGGGGVKNIDLTVNDGEFVVLCGRSGCGKTTLTRLANGLAYHFYAGRYDGTVTIDGKSVRDMPIFETGRLVGSVFQDPRDGFFAKYVEGETAFACENYGFSPTDIRARVAAALGAVGIENLRFAELKKLSSGEKQKVAIASVYAPAPKIYVFDEPSSNLDAAATLALADVMRALKADGKTVVVSEHRVNYLMNLADKFVYIDGGEIARVFTPREFANLSDAESAALGLRTPRPCAVNLPPRGDSGGGGNAGLRLNALSVSYGKKELISGFSLSLRPGDILAVTGTNGCGKTSLCRVIAGLKRQNRGEILFNGKKLPPRKRLAAVYYVANGADNQLFSSSVRDELLLGLKADPKTRERADAILAEFGLSEYADRHPLLLSGGQKQRLTLAVAFMRDRSVIVLDEPTSGLDLTRMRHVADAIKTASVSGKIIIVVSHDAEFVNRVCNKSVIIGS